MSIVVRKSLGRQLKALRTAAGKTPAAVETAKVASTSKLHRVEAGAVPVKVADVWAFCRLYDADSSTTDRLAEMARNTTEKGWWESYDAVMPSWFGTYVELESAASRLYVYDPDLIHGLLQTPAYHRALIEVDPERSAESADLQLRLRGGRQQAAFERVKPLEVVAVFGEGALARTVGGAEGMAQQKRRLLELSEMGNVQVSVLPFNAGAHVAMKGPFTVLAFDSDDDHPDVVYLETHAGARYIEADEAVHRYRTNLRLIIEQSVPLKEYMQ